MSRPPVTCPMQTRGGDRPGSEWSTAPSEGPGMPLLGGDQARLVTSLYLSFHSRVCSSRRKGLSKDDLVL